MKSFNLTLSQSTTFCHKFVACETVFEILLENQSRAGLIILQLIVRKSC